MTPASSQERTAGSRFTLPPKTTDKICETIVFRDYAIASIGEESSREGNK